MNHKLRITLGAVILVIVAFAMVPAALANNAEQPNPAASQADGTVYVVRRGDSLGAIAARFGTSVATLARANGIRNPNLIFAGQRLVIPGRGSTTTGSGGSTAAASGGTYVVRRGDSLGAIAVRYGTSVAALARANRIANPSVIYVGQRLAIPGRGAAASTGSGSGSAPAPKPASAGRWIDVNVRTQRVTAYEGNRAVYSVPASTGIARYPTVLGRFRVYVKLRSTRVTGPGYDLPSVPYTMYYYKGYAVHGAYWHNNFGRPMSHGCVNLRPSDAKWFFNFASVGTPVVVHR